MIKGITIEVVKRMYLDEDKTTGEIVKILNCNPQVIYNRLRKANISLIQKPYRNYVRYYCKDCGKQVANNRTKRCKPCSIIDKNRKYQERLEKDVLKGFRILISKMNQIEHLKEIGFKKGIKNLNPCGFLFVKGHSRTKGEKHPNWQGGIGKDPYDFSFNNNFKDEIRKRDGFACLKCDKIESQQLQEIGRKLTIHHINYDKKLTIPENCCALCNSCNFEVNYKREHWKKFFQSLLAGKYGYTYSENGELIKEIGGCYAT